jgi:uncharacterized iron-regulated membrane protein
MAAGAKKFNYKHYIRRTHRYLGVFIGIQFILWTVGGLYFSWTDLDEIHGDHLRARSQIDFSVPDGSASPDQIVNTVRSLFGPTRITRIYFVKVLGSYYYAIEHEMDGKRSTVLLSVEDASIRPAISSTEARQIAMDALANPSEPFDLVYLSSETVSKHHEYREQPLPAWLASFENNVSVYLSAETGQVHAVRTNKWRVFDFLWMLHTMDFQGRDNINNYVLRGFSILGLVTVLSGFSLFLVSSRSLRKFAIRRRVKVE